MRSLSSRAWREREYAAGIYRTNSRGANIVTTVIVPKAGGVTTTKANVVRWLKHEGDPVERGEPLVELETEKISYELDSPAAGILLKIVARESTAVPVGDALCHIGASHDVVPRP